jgi:hypothetical protein
MKKSKLLLTIAMILAMWQMKAQTVCVSAASISTVSPTVDSCNTYTKWYTFTAIKGTTSLETSSAGFPTGSTMELFSGTCASLTSLGKDSIASTSQHELEVDASTTIGNTYYVKLHFTTSSYVKYVINIIDEKFTVINLSTLFSSGCDPDGAEGPGYDCKDVHICKGDTLMVSFDGYGSSIPITVYMSGSAIGTITNPNGGFIKYATNSTPIGLYSITIHLPATSNDTVPVHLTVFQPPVLYTSITPTNVCTGTPVCLNLQNVVGNNYYAGGGGFSEDWGNLTNCNRSYPTGLPPCPDCNTYTTSGTYTIQLSMSNAVCPGTATLSQVVHVTDMNLSLTYSNTACNYMFSAPLNCSTTNTVSYNWVFFDGTTNQNLSTSTNTLSYTFPYSGTYTMNVSATSGSLTTATHTISFTVTTPTLSVSQTNGVCPVTSSTLSVSGGSSYTWTPCSSSCNTSSLIVTPTVQTTYTVKAGSGTCISITTISVNPIFCCSSGSVIAESSSTGTALPAGVYTLNHPYTITSDFTLGGVTIFMGSNAEIIVNNNVTLNLTTAHLLGCPNMWKGIRFVGSTGSVVLSKNVLIEDAVTAIDLSTVTTAASGSLIINSTDATFNKNYTGIAIGTYTNTGYYPTNFNSTVFTCRKLITNDHCTYLGICGTTYTWNASTANYALKTTSYTPSASNISSGTSVRVTDEFSAATYSTTTLGIPYQANVSRQGIYLNGVGVTNTVTLTGFKIGDGGRDFNSLNLFDNLSYGIYSVNSNVSSKNCAYQEMQQYSISHGPGRVLMTYDGGVGIYCQNDLAYTTPTKLEALSINNTFDQTSNFFFNNIYGVKTANVQYVDVEWAMIHSKRPYPPPTSMTAGTTEVGEYGIFAKTLDYRNINVVHNAASNLGTAVTFMADYAIIRFQPTQYAGTVTVNNNLIEADYGTNTSNRGITQAIRVDNLFNCFGCTIHGNTSAIVSIANNKIYNVFNGIECSNWLIQPVSVNTNTLTMINSTYSATAYPQFGIRNENNYGDVIAGNSITGFGLSKTNVYAIRVADNRNQIISCNSTTNTYEGMFFTGAMNLCTWYNNTMSTHVHGMTLYNTTIGAQGTSTAAISNTWSGSWTGHSQTYVNGLDPAAGTGGYNSKLYMGTLPTLNTANPPANNYKTSGTLQSLFTASGSFPLCPVTVTFTTWGGSHGLHRFQKNLDNIANGSYYYSPYIDPNQANGNFELYREIASDTSLMTGDSTLRAFHSTYSTSILDQFNKAENALAVLDYTTAATQVAAMSPGSSIEQNTQNLYSIYLDAQNKAYTAADDSTLLALAKGCPTRDGIVVYQARVLYNSLYDQATIFNNICDTVTTGGKAGHPSDLVNQPISPNFMVYPNPNNGNVYVSVDHLNLTSYDIKVYDVTGKMLLNKHYTDAGVKELNLDFESGIYLVEVADSEGKTNYKQKIVIQR